MTDLLPRESSLYSKGIAIILVVLSHFAGLYTNLRYFSFFGGVGVSVFLILSGYGISSSIEKNKLNDFWKKRLISVFT